MLGRPCKIMNRKYLAHRKGLTDSSYYCYCCCLDLDVQMPKIMKQIFLVRETLSKCAHRCPETFIWAVLVHVYFVLQNLACQGKDYLDDHQLSSPSPSGYKDSL